MLTSRSDIPSLDQWDLSSLYSNDKIWETTLLERQSSLKELTSFQGHLGESLHKLTAFLKLYEAEAQITERITTYAFLRFCENVEDPQGNVLYEKAMGFLTQWNTALSFVTPEIVALSSTLINEILNTEGAANYRVFLTKIIRSRPHTLSEKEESILAQQGRFDDNFSTAFSALTNADMSFGTIMDAEEEKSLTQASFSLFLQHPSRDLRKQAYEQFYGVFDGHKNTLAQLLGGSIKKDAFHASVRGFSSSLEASLFTDDITQEVYRELIEAVRKGLPELHRYYRIKKDILCLEELCHYDVYAPLIPSIKSRIPYDEAVDTVIEALSPLGEEYQKILKKGLQGGWVDRYENKGKRSGAFSSGSYNAYPYILMNYQEENITDMFTLAHEAGHSMHSWYAARNNPFLHYNYSIFEAEIASTVNEELLAHHLIECSSDVRFRLFIINKQTDALLATFFRQTMFAEFELMTHEHEEANKALTLDTMRGFYAQLLADYFGEEVSLPEQSSLECLRIPHFYNAFYVYKYATGISAAQLFCERLLDGERENYLRFLKRGGQLFALENLRTSQITITEAVKRTLSVFARRIDQLSELTKLL